jgi:hypothetical protein
MYVVHRWIAPPPPPLRQRATNARTHLLLAPSGPANQSSVRPTQPRQAAGWRALVRKASPTVDPNDRPLSKTVRANK